MLRVGITPSVEVLVLAMPVEKDILNLGAVSAGCRTKQQSADSSAEVPFQRRSPQEKTSASLLR